MKLRIDSLIFLIVSFVKGLLTTAKHSQKIKNYDKTKEKLDTIEHMVSKLEKRIADTRNEIESLRQQVMFSRLMNLVLFIVVIFLVIYLR